MDSAADPRFPRAGGGGNKHKSRMERLIIRPNFPETVWKWKIAPRGDACPKCVFVDPPLGLGWQKDNTTVFQLMMFITSIEFQFALSTKHLSFWLVNFDYNTNFIWLSHYMYQPLTDTMSSEKYIYKTKAALKDEISDRPTIDLPKFRSPPSPRVESSFRNYNLFMSLISKAARCFYLTIHSFAHGKTIASGLHRECL